MMRRRTRRRVRLRSTLSKPRLKLLLQPRARAYSPRKATVAKFGEQAANEDYAYGDRSCIALSDGAGGCGLYADRWSRYLVSELDKKRPIESYEQLDAWVGEIWQPFYDACEAEAMQGDAMLLNKFYSEGSCATLVAAWLLPGGRCHWLAYGDSLLFRYDRARGELWHSFTQLADFDKSPYLISCKDPLTPEGFSQGTMQLDEQSIVFAASDALSHFILMMYQVSRWDSYRAELDALVASHSSDSHLLQLAQATSYRFYEDIIEPLMQAASSDIAFASLMRKWHELGLLELDDYSVVFLRP